MIRHRSSRETGTQIFERHRPLLFSIAYRMLGSAMDAEDVVQEAYLRWQGTEEEVRSPKAYLSTVVTARKPAYGADRVARLMLGLARKRWPGYTIRLAGINGRPGIIGYSGHRPDSVLDLEIANGRIRIVRNVRNPDKLHAVPRLNETQRSEKW